MNKRASKSDDRRKSITTLKGTSSWGEWLNRYAEFRRTTVVGLIDLATSHLAKADGFEIPPKR